MYLSTKYQLWIALINDDEDIFCVSTFQGWLDYEHLKFPRIISELVFNKVNK